MNDRPIGMAPEEVERIAHTIASLRASLEAASSRVDEAALVSLNPLSYGLQPGALVIAPLSIIGTMRAAAEVRSALGALDHLVNRLHQEADHQRETSHDASRPSISAASPTVGVPSPPRGATPQEVREWWNGLSEEERAAIIAEKPESVANLDGIPASVRDTINRHELDEVINDPARPDHEREVASNIRDNLRRMEENEQGTVFQVLSVDLSNPDNPEAIISVGDVESSDVLVPVIFGINTDATSTGDCLEASSALRFETMIQLQEVAPGQTVATIMYLGYDSGDASTVTGDQNAIDAAPGLIDFFDGLRAGSSDSVVVPVSHSYGTRAVAEALSTGGVADGAVFVASPGLPDDIQHVSDLTGVPSEHVYSGRSDSDWTASGFYRGAEGIDGIGRWVARRFDPNVPDNPANPDPTSESFGANRIETPTQWELPGFGHDAWDSNGGAYFSPTSPAQREIAGAVVKVVADHES